MADGDLPREVSWLNSGLRSPLETQRSIDFLLAEMAKLQDRVESMRSDVQEAHDRIDAMKADNERPREAL